MSHSNTNTQWTTSDLELLPGFECLVGQFFL